MESIKRAFFLTLLVLVCSVVQAQSLQVSGTIVSKSDGQPVIGATILEQGTTNGTITDFDGNFSLTVKQNAEISISYIGFKTQVVKAQSVLNIVLEEDTEVLEEVVVTGYTTQRKADLTGAVSVVSVDELSKQNENNPMKALQGRVPGMNVTADGNPSGSTTIRIRGVGTLNNNDPLYIIDGVPTKAGMHELNGNDIESIQVLKDAASASIYGSRAANGVIIITTKKGKEGKLKIDFDASVSASMYNNKMEVLNAKEYGQAMWQAYVNGGQDPNTNSLGYKYDWGFDSNGYPRLNGISMSRFLDSNNTVPSADTDWFDETGASYTIQVGILKDVVTLAIDTSGSGLHMRGYRASALDAPLKESLASAMVQLSYWRKDRILLDPFCGSGTIPIEAAMLARNIAPGLNRKFASEEWERIGKERWKQARKEAYQAIDYDVMPEIYGSDIDPAAIELAKANAELAGVDDCIIFEVKPSQEIVLPGKYGVLISNPPYGERIGELKEVENMYRALGATMQTDPTWSTYIITSMEYFESLFGRKADRKRKLFNGRIKTDYYQYEGPRPPKKQKTEEN